MIPLILFLVFVVLIPGLLIMGHVSRKRKNERYSRPEDADPFDGEWRDGLYTDEYHESEIQNFKKDLEEKGIQRAVTEYAPSQTLHIKRQLEAGVPMKDVVDEIRANLEQTKKNLDAAAKVLKNGKEKN